MTYAEYQVYIQSIDEVESRIDDDTKFPVVSDNKIKICCKTTLEISKALINYLKYNINWKGACAPVQFPYSSDFKVLGP